MVRYPGRLRDLEIFAIVVEEGSFSAAARATGLTPSAVSKTMTRLEERLDTRLIVRTTRALTLTAEGDELHTRTLAILSALDVAERAAGRGKLPAGPVCISTSASFAQHVLYPKMPILRESYPRLICTVSQTDEVVDLVEARADIAIRAGDMPSSSLIARSLGASAQAVVAAPDYLDRVGTPAAVEDLSMCDLIGFSYRRRSALWPFLQDGQEMGLRTKPALLASDGEGMRQMALYGLGIARLARFTVVADLSAGRLVEILPNANPGDFEPFHAVRLGAGSALPARLRVVLDFLAQHCRVDRIGVHSS